MNAPYRPTPCLDPVQSSRQTCKLGLTPVKLLHCTISPSRLMLLYQGLLTFTRIAAEEMDHARHGETLAGNRS